MAFIEIVRGNDIKRVPESMSEYYRKFGYRRKKSVKKSYLKKETEEPDIDTIPLSEMTKEQLKEFAAKRNIDTSGAKNTREARGIIQRVLQERKM